MLSEVAGFRYIFATRKRSLSVLLSKSANLRDTRRMAPRRPLSFVLTLIGISGLAVALCAPGFAAEQTTKKSKKHAGETVLVPAPQTPAEQYDAPLQLNFDPMKSVLLKPDPVLPYQPLSPTKPRASSKTADADDTPGQPHLAPLLRESSLPDSFGDRGTFLERHEFGIQLRDHF